MQIVRESIFVSAIRSFINAFFALIGVLVGFLILVAVLSNFGKSQGKSVFSDLEIEVLPDRKGNTTLLAESSPVILNIDIEGVIGLDDLQSGIIRNMLLASRQGIFKDGRIKAIMLNINSPGGVAIDSADIYHSLKEYKEMYNIPIMAYVNGFCASGGYYIACAADEIAASPLSLVGSVGVRFGPNFNFFGLMEKLGVKEKTFTAGKHKVKWPMFEQLPPDGSKETSYSDLQKTINETYQNFLTVVSDARSKYGLTRDLLTNDYGAQIYIASDAKSKGYINQDNVYYYDALEELAKKLNFEDGSYQLYRFKHKPPFVESLMRGELVKMICSPVQYMKKLTFGSAGKPELIYIDAN